MSEYASLTQGLGLTQAQVGLYLMLVERPPTSTATLAEQVDRSTQDVVADLIALRETGLVLRTFGEDRAVGAEDPSGAEWTAADPDHAVRALIRTHEDALNDARLLVPSLQGRFHRIHGPSFTDAGLERINGWENIGSRYHDLMRSAEEEVAIWDHGPYTTGEAPTETSVLEGGVGFRVLCHPDGLPQETVEQFTALRRLEARTHLDVAMRGVIVDRATCMLMMDRSTPNVTGIVLTGSPLLDLTVAAFDLMWSAGVAVSVGSPGGSPLDSAEHRVLTLLAAGYKDETIARETGTTTRTVRRRVQTVMTALRARSRFQAGVEAHRRGWL